jgi:AraC-like DNA-binding protein
VARLRDLRGWTDPDFLSSPHRLDFHQIMLVTAGQGTYSIDSTPLECRPGTLLWSRPNQVIQYRPQPDMDGDVIMFTEAFPLQLNAWMGRLDDVLRPSHWQLRGPDLSAFQQVLSVLQAEFARPDQELGEELLKHLLAVVLLHIDRLCRQHHHGTLASAGALSSDKGELFIRFRRELDRRYRETRLVEDYAAALNCSTRALARACQVVGGASTKDVIDARVALEARRLLVHTDLPITAIARLLGFSEVTNFGKFFVRRVHMTPGAFRREAKSSDHSATEARRP